MLKDEFARELLDALELALNDTEAIAAYVYNCIEPVIEKHTGVEIVSTERREALTSNIAMRVYFEKHFNEEVEKNKNLVALLNEALPFVSDMVGVASGARHVFHKILRTTETRGADEDEM